MIMVGRALVEQDEGQAGELDTGLLCDVEVVFDLVEVSDRGKGVKHAFFLRQFVLEYLGVMVEQQVFEVSLHRHIHLFFLRIANDLWVVEPFKLHFIEFITQRELVIRTVQIHKTRVLHAYQLEVLRKSQPDNVVDFFAKERLIRLLQVIYIAGQGDHVLTRVVFVIILQLFPVRAIPGRQRH